MNAIQWVGHTEFAQKSDEDWLYINVVQQYLEVRLVVSRKIFNTLKQPRAIYAYNSQNMYSCISFNKEEVMYP